MCVVYDGELWQIGYQPQVLSGQGRLRPKRNVNRMSQIVRNGLTALETVFANQSDVVLLDIGLPGMDGYEVAKRLREMPESKKLVICALTGYTPSIADQQWQQETGFDHYFVKPVCLEKLTDLFKDNRGGGSVTE